LKNDGKKQRRYQLELPFIVEIVFCGNSHFLHLSLFFFFLSFDQSDTGKQERQRKHFKPWKSAKLAKISSAKVAEILLKAEIRRSPPGPIYETLYKMG